MAESQSASWSGNTIVVRKDGNIAKIRTRATTKHHPSSRPLAAFLLEKAMEERSTPRRLERFKSVCVRTGYSRPHLYRLIAQKKFPSPCRIGDYATAFDADQIDAWIAEKTASPGVGTSQFQRKRPKG